MAINKCFEFECDVINCDEIIGIQHFLSMGADTITKAKIEARRLGWKVTMDECLCKRCKETPEGM